MNDLTAPPLNPLPPVVWLLALPMIAIEVACQCRGERAGRGGAMRWGGGRS